MAKEIVHSDRPVLTEWPLPRRLLDWVRAPEWSGLFEDETLKVEEFEQNGHLVIRAEMPGIDPEKDVELRVEHGVLSVRAERRQSSETSDKGRYRSEFRYGSFARRIALPPEASHDDVKATYKDGILEIKVPVDHTARAAHKIEVQRV